DLSYSDVWNNTVPSTCGIEVVNGAGVISENPQYVAPSADLHLQSTSVCIDSGIPTDAPDHDLDGNPRPLNGDGINGAEFDMGAYEFADSVAITTTTSTTTTSTTTTGTGATSTTLSLLGEEGLKCQKAIASTFPKFGGKAHK